MAHENNRPYCTHCASRVTSVFKSVEDGELATMDDTKACNTFRKGDVIFEAGGAPKGLFCIHHGKIKIYQTGDEGRDHIVRFAKAGDVVGYRALLSGESYTVSASALEDSVVCCIPVDSFFAMLKGNDAFSMDVMKLISGELGRAEKQIVNLAQKPVRERLAQAILLLREVYGMENGDGSPINVALSRDELASVVGTATETLVRTLADFKRENLIATDKKKIRILDLGGLVNASNLLD